MNKYINIYMPNHNKAHSNGCVYEHIIVAEQKIGRSLTPEEVVHHIDEDKSNNNPDNLMIFSTVADHTGFHQGCKLIDNMDGTFSTERKDSKQVKIICPICGNEMSLLANMCLECYKKEQAKNIPSKDQLINDLCDNLCNKSAIGRKYNVSDKAVDKWCNKYGIIKGVTFISTHIKGDIPSKEQLEKDLKDNNYIKAAVARKYDVDDSTVTQWCKKLNI